MKTPMSGQNISISHRLLSSWKILNAYRSGIFGDVDDDLQLHYKLIEVIREHFQRDPNGMKILDIGCGQTATQVSLFKADGAEIVGIDAEVPTFEINFTSFKKIIKMNGFERALKSLVRHLFYDKKYFSA